MPAPNLIWTMTALSAPADPLSVQAVLDAIEAAVIAHADWQVYSKAANELEIGPVPTVPAPVNNMRLLLATGVNAAQVASPHTAVAGVLYMGLAPDGGTLGDAHGAAAPYGASRWSGYWKISGVITGADETDNVFVLASKEVFSVWLQEADAEDWRGGIGGCIIEAPSDGDGEGTPGRVYGMAVSGTDLVSATFWQTSTEFLGGSGAGNLDAQVGIFKPSLPATWARLTRADNSAAGASPRYETTAGTRLTVPVLYHYKDAPYNAVGALRQIRKAQDGLMRRIVQDGAAVDKSFQVGGSTIASGDVASFDNG